MFRTVIGLLFIFTSTAGALNAVPDELESLWEASRQEGGYDGFWLPLDAFSADGRAYYVGVSSAGYSPSGSKTWKVDLTNGTKTELPSFMPFGRSLTLFKQTFWEWDSNEYKDVRAMHVFNPKTKERWKFVFPPEPWDDDGKTHLSFDQYAVSGSGKYSPFANSKRINENRHAYCSTQIFILELQSGGQTAVTPLPTNRLPGSNCIHIKSSRIDENDVVYMEIGYVGSTPTQEPFDEATEGTIGRAMGLWIYDAKRNRELGFVDYSQAQANGQYVGFTKGILVRTGTGKIETYNLASGNWELVDGVYNETLSLYSSKQIVTGNLDQSVIHIFNLADRTKLAYKLPSPAKNYVATSAKAYDLGSKGTLILRAGIEYGAKAFEIADAFVLKPDGSIRPQKLPPGLQGLRYLQSNSSEARALFWGIEVSPSGLVRYYVEYLNSKKEYRHKARFVWLK